MKKVLVKLDKLPTWLLYIMFIALLCLFTYCFPRLSRVLGFIWQYGLYAFFGLFVVGSVIAAIASNVQSIKKSIEKKRSKNKVE